MNVDLEDVINGLRIISSIISMFQEKDEMLQKATNYLDFAIKEYNQNHYAKAKDAALAALHFYEKSDQSKKHQLAIVWYSTGGIHLLLAYCNMSLGNNKDVYKNYTKAISNFKCVENMEITWFTLKTGDIKKLQASASEMVYHLKIERKEWDEAYRAKYNLPPRRFHIDSEIVYGIIRFIFIGAFIFGFIMLFLKIMK